MNIGYVNKLWIFSGIQVISSNFKVLQVFQGLTRSASDSKDSGNTIPTGLLLDPRTKSLVLNGRPGHLQFYSLEDDKQLYNVSLVRGLRNTI